MDGVLAVVAAGKASADRVAAEALRVQELAAELRAAASRLAAAGRLEWRAPSADAFRERLQALVDAVRQCADLVDAAAQALRAHAAAASHRADLVAALAGAVEAAVTQGLDDAARIARRALEDALPRPLVPP